MSEGKTDQSGGQPAKFLWDICGHEPIVDFLKSAVASGKPSHAYIFAGQDGLGKYAVAEKFALSLFCSSSEHRPCGECSGCRQALNKVHPDFFLVNRLTDEKTGKLKREIVIDQVRDLKHRLSQASLLSGYKVAIVRGADDLNTNSANSLLKLLEEPTKRTVIILIAKDAGNLPKTVTSRCQVLQFLPVATEKISAYLQEKGTSPERAGRLAHLSLGRPALAIDWLTNYEGADNFRKQLEGFYNLAEKNLSARLKDFDKLVDFSTDESSNLLKVGELLDIWQVALRDLLLFNSNNERLLADQSRSARKVAATFSWDKIMQTHYRINACRKLLESGVSSKNALENLVIQI